MALRKLVRFDVPNYCARLGETHERIVKSASNLTRCRRQIRQYRSATSIPVPEVNNVQHRCYMIARSFHTSTRVSDIFSYSDVDYIVSVKTGDQIHSGTDANVKIVLHGDDGQVSEPIKLDYFFRDDFERGQLDTFQLKSLSHMKDINKIELWRDNSGLGSDWYVDYIEIESTGSRKRFLFPIFRWIKAERHYLIRQMDNFLPQLDPEPWHRKEELDEKQREYECGMKIPGGPAQNVANSLEPGETPSDSAYHQAPSYFNVLKYRKR